MENYLGIYKKYWAKKIPEGTHQAATNLEGASYTPGRAIVACGTPSRPPVPIFCYMEGFDLEKIRRELSGRSAAVSRRNLGRTNLGLRRSCSAGETSLPVGEIEAIVITNDPLIERGSISINIFTSTISSPNPSSSRVSDLCLKPQIGTCGLLVVLITPCS